MSSRICMSEVSMLVHSDLTSKLSLANGISLIFWMLLFIVLVLWAILLLWRAFNVVWWAMTILTPLKSDLDLEKSGQL